MGIHYESNLRPAIFEWRRFSDKLATDIGVSSTIPHIWIVGDSPRDGGYEVCRWTGFEWQTHDVGAVIVEPSPKGDAWLVNDRGELLEPFDGGWQVCPTPAPVRDVSLALQPVDDGVWIATAPTDGKPGQILRRVGSEWVENYNTPTRVDKFWFVPGDSDDDENFNDPYPGAWPENPIALACMADGLPWIVNEDGAILRQSRNNVGWLRVPNEPANDIAISPGGNVWLIGRDDRGPLGQGIYRYYHGTDWHAYEGALVRIAVGPDSLPFGVDAAGQIWRMHVKS
jgi:hypothetical protein